MAVILLVIILASVPPLFSFGKLSPISKVLYKFTKSYLGYHWIILKIVTLILGTLNFIASNKTRNLLSIKEKERDEGESQTRTITFNSSFIDMRKKVTSHPS